MVNYDYVHAGKVLVFYGQRMKIVDITTGKILWDNMLYIEDDILNMSVDFLDEKALYLYNDIDASSSKLVDRQIYYKLTLK